MWPWSSSKTPPIPEQKPEPEPVQKIEQFKKELASNPQLAQAQAALSEAETALEPVPRLVLVAGSLALGGVLTTVFIRFHGHRFSRLQNGEWVTPDWLNGKRWVKGVVVRVGDGDNFRLYHTPIFGGHHWPFRFRRTDIPTTKVAQNTLHIRLAGVDAPETSHFGKPAQPFAEESMKWLSDTILNKKVYCQLVRRDQYSRVVANVYLPYVGIPASISRGRNVSLEMLKAGWATVYSQSGAEYGDAGEEQYKRVEQEAKKARRGIWVHGELKETPAQYKKRLAGAGGTPEEATVPPIPPQPQKRGLLSRLFGRS